MYTITLNLEQQNALKGLAYWQADIKYLLERYGEKDAAHEIDTARKTIQCCFTRCDQLKLPFWVQNAVLAFAWDWRQYKTVYMWEYLKNRGYNITLA